MHKAVHNCIYSGRTHYLSDIFSDHCTKSINVVLNSFLEQMTQSDLLGFRGVPLTAVPQNMKERERQTEERNGLP